MNALLGGKQGGSSGGHNSNSSPFGGLANQVISGLTHSNGGGHGQQQQHHGSSAASSGLGGKLVGQLTSNLFSSGNKPAQPQNYHSGQASQAPHNSGGLAGSMMGSVAHMFGGQSGASVCLHVKTPGIYSAIETTYILTDVPHVCRTKTLDTQIPARQEPTVAPPLLPHTNRQAHPRSTSLPPKGTTPSPPTTPKPRAHPPPTTRPNIPRAFLRRRASTRDNMATRASSSSNTRRMDSTAKYQARPPAHHLRNTASPSMGRAMATSRPHRHTGATSKAGTTGWRRHSLHLRVNTSPRQDMAARTVVCHMGRITTAAIPRTRRAGDSVIKREANGLLGDPSQGILRLTVRSIGVGLRGPGIPTGHHMQQGWVRGT